MVDLGLNIEIAETGKSLEENSLIKAKYVSDRFHVDAFSDDTGLEVDSLNGAPGVMSARYAGEEGNSEQNIALLLHNLKGKNSRKARFRAVITLIQNGEMHQFEGICEGEITRTLKGKDGFGYDPVFKPSSHTSTFAEMSAQEKNSISHRGLAMKKFMDFILS